jgi:hypothetical protein
MQEVYILILVVFISKNLRIEFCGIFQVVLESMRMASVISFPFREAVADVEYKGKSNTFYICKSIQNGKIFLGSNYPLCNVTAILSPYYYTMLKIPNVKNVHFK